MLRNDLVVVGLVTAYLVVFCILLQINATIGIALMMFSLSPFFIAWMVLTVLVFGKYHGPELGEKEFGYQDKELHS